jgi:phosphoribosylanthranilate isomerase
VTRVKICGLREIDHARAAVDAGAEMLGLNFYRPVRRYVAPAAARALVAALPRGGVELVGIFVNESVETILEVVDLVGLDMVQLSGDEPPELTVQLGLPVARTVHVDAATTLAEVAARAAGARLIHLDTRQPGQYGGTGLRFDPQFAREAAALGRVMMAGGLNVANIGGAIEAARPWGVDVSSGVETDGQKDPQKIAAFVAAVRAADRLTVPR